MFSAIDKELNALIQQLPETSEGYLTPAQADYLFAFVKLTRPKLVAETGFNVGHSACVILRAMDSYAGGTLLSFDVGRHEGTARGAEIVKKRYEHFHLIVGDSKKTLGPTLSRALNANSNATLDMAIVDGGHDVETVQHDMIVCESMLKGGGYLWLDDFENNQCIIAGVNIVGREFAMSRKHCLRFQTHDHRGMMIYQKGF